MEVILVKIGMLICGFLLAWFIRPLTMDLVGELRVDNADPEQENMFLEIYKGKYQLLKKSTYVLLKVNRKSYISHK